jgi:acetyltransferase-like isoleucine patch superfamily enzyme
MLRNFYRTAYYARRAVFTLIFRLMHRHISSPVTVNGFTRLNRNSTIGRDCSFNGFVVLGAGTIDVGDNFHSGSGCRFFSQVHNYEGNALPYDSTYRYKHLVIEDNVWFGSDVTVLASARIGEGAIIQACAVVVGDIPKFAIAGGNPARVFSTRNADHYLRLKEMGTEG